MNSDTTTAAVSWACQHQDTVIALIGYIGAVLGSSALAGVLKRWWHGFPPWLHTLLNIIAGNFIQAVTERPAPHPPAVG